MAFSNKDFVQLHVHSEFSQFDGLAPIKKLAMKAREMGFPAIGLTDHGNIAAWLKFLKFCTDEKDKDGKAIPFAPVKPLLGCEFYLARHREFKNKELQPEGKKGNRHLVLFAKNFKGYQNLCSLSEKSWVEGFYHSPRIDFELLAKHHEGIICTSACLSSVINANLLHDRYDHAKRAASMFKDLFGEDFFLEVMYHGLDAERYVIPDIFKLSKELDVPVIATNDCHYIEKNQAKSHEVLMCMSTSKCINDPKHIHFPYGEFYLKDAEEMAKIFGHVPSCMHNTVALAERVNIDDIANNLFGGMKLPRIEVPSDFKKGEPFEDQFRYLKKLAEDGMKERKWDQSPRHLKQLNVELNDIRVAWENNEYDFATYFLIEYSIMNFAKEKNILTGPGRGSGYASVLLHSIGVAYGVDPLDYDLLWPRFLAFDDKRFINASDLGLTENKTRRDVSVNEEEDNALEGEEGFEDEDGDIF